MTAANKFTLALACGVAALGALPASTVWAASPTAAEPLSTQSERPATGTVPASAYPKPPPGPPGRKRAGWPVGSFLLLPELNARIGYDDNVFATPTNEKEDGLVIVSPSVSLKSNWRRNQLNLSAGSDLGRYRRYTSENYNDYYVDSSGRFDLTRRVNLFGGAGYSYNHEARTSPDAVSGTEPTVYTDTHAFAGSAFGLGRFAMRVGASASRLNFSNVPSSSGEIYNDDRDRDVAQAGGRLSYNLSARLHPFLQGNYDRRLYVTPTDQYGYRRDSNGYRVAAGLRFDFKPNLEGEALAGFMHQSYEDPGFDAVNAPDFGLRLGWRKSAVSSLGFFVDRRLEETTVPGSAGYISTRMGMNMERSLGPKWSVNAHAAVMNDAYQDIPRTDRVTDAGVGFAYQITRHVALEADYRLLNRNSDDPTADYFSNEVFVGVRSRLYPLASAPYTPVLGGRGKGPTEGLDISGLYFGAETGYGSLSSELSGARGEEGSESAEYGDTGASSELFAGYGFMHKRWYWGVEAHGDTSDADWSHEKPGGRIFSVEKHQGYGADARLGYMLNTGALLFTSLGGTWTQFETRYQLDPSSPYVRSDDTVFGRRYGLGVDVPVSSHMFVRMDYTYTDYNKYSVNYGSDSETFGNSEGLFRVGLGWMLAGHDISAPQRRPRIAKAGGLYAGAAVGYGALNTPIHADQTQSSSPPTTLDADFSSRGMTTNVFAGYGFTLDHLYLGVEADTEIGKANWAHTREPSGRSFSVDKKGDLGVSLRVGWALDNGTLFYADVGRVRSKFHTTYIKGNNSAYWVSRDDKETGTRYGVGVDVPITQAFFLRLDYSYTHYNPYQFTTQQAYSDTVRFDNNEAMFKLGLGFRL